MYQSAYQHYQKNIPNFAINNVGQKYLDLFQQIYKDVKEKKYSPKKTTSSNYFHYYKYILSNTVNRIKSKLS